MGFTPHWRRAEAQRRYREANREKVSEGKRELREFRGNTLD